MELPEFRIAASQRPESEASFAGCSGEAGMNADRRTPARQDRLERRRRSAMDNRKNTERDTVPRRGLDTPSRHMARALASALGLTAASIAPATTYTVNTTGDPGGSGTLSLRQAVAAANASDGNAVQFDPSLAGSTITLATGELLIDHAMSIIGPGADRLAISGANSSRIFKLDCPYYGSKAVSISSLTLVNGSTSGDGGALYSHNCQLLLSGAVATASHATSGGCIAFDNGTITNSVISGCHADQFGGGIEINTAVATPHIDLSTITSNTAGNGGGGVLLNNVNAGFSSLITHIARSTISNNSATSTVTQYGGGGILVAHSGLQLYYSTVAQNAAYASGGGIRFLDSYSATLSRLFRSTVALNSSQKTNGNGVFSTGGPLDVSWSIVAGNFNKYGLTDLSGSFSVPYSLVQYPGGATVTGNGSMLGIDPDLAPLDDYGGPTETMLPYAFSPAIDAIPSCALTDQRGLDACVNDSADMGAVERQSPEVIIFRDGFESG
jgi:hypothetical protein